jgi:dihydropteroate synthase
MSRKIFYWKLRSTELQLGEKTLIMGILNVTPDSFSDGGNYSDPDRAYARALELEEQGADIIDIGGESTRPGSQRVSAEEEWRRLAPVLKRLRDNLRVPISLDTYKAETAERALEYGIEIINDPSGLTFDSDLAKVVMNANAGLILNHMRGTPETWAKLPPLPDMMGSVTRDLEATINRARRAGVERNRIAIDPGLGFGKRREQNSEIIAHLQQLAALDCPVLIGPSRKSFLAELTDETLFASAAAVALSIVNGAHIVRVHDVKEMRAVVLVADEVARATAAVKAAADLAKAERAVPRKAMREFDDRPRSVKPPLVAKAPEPTPPPEAPEVVAQEMTASEVAAPEVTPAKEPPQREKRPFAERPPRRESTDRPPRKDFTARPPRRDSGDRPPRREFSDRPPRRDSADRPPRRDSGDRPPRRDFGDRKAPSGDRPVKRSFGDRPAKPGFGDRPPKRAFGDRPPRRDFGSGPPKRDFGDRPPRRDFGDRPPRGDAGPPRGKSPGSRPSGPRSGGPRPPNRPFRKRP